jgi:hypothetical protein
MSWVTATAEHLLAEEVPALPDAVRGFYTDLDNLRIVHPLIVSVHATGRTDTTDGYEQTYRVHDRIPLGPITLPISYVARLYVPRAGDVVSEARQFPMVRLNSTVSFESTATGTRITERVRIEAPRPLAAVTVREAVDSHTAMLAGIRRHFE